MSTYTPELIFSLICLLILLTCCIGLWMKSRDDKTDDQMRKGMAETYKRGWIARGNHEHH